MDQGQSTLQLAKGIRNLSDEQEMLMYLEEVINSPEMHPKTKALANEWMDLIMESREPYRGFSQVKKNAKEIVLSFKSGYIY